MGPFFFFFLLVFFPLGKVTAGFALDIMTTDRKQGMLKQKTLKCFLPSYHLDDSDKASYFEWKSFDGRELLAFIL